MPRKPADQTVNRADILQAAAHVFHDRGYHGATMQDISAEVGLTAGSLYHHFSGGKEAIFVAVLEEGLMHVMADVQAIVESELPPPAKLRQAIRAHVLGVTNHIAIAALMIFEMRTALSLPELPQHYLAQRDEFEGLYRRMIAEGVESGVFRPVDVGVFTRTLLGASNWVSVWYRPEGRLTGEAIADEIADVFLCALLAK
jgi:AcrR family transcriptional regulator